MSNIIKSAKLDFSLLKPYPLTICFYILLPFLITVFTLSRSLAVDIFFVMLIFGTTTGYPFFIVEKNSAERLYGILPIRKSEFVIGRYIYIISIGLTALIASLIIHPIALSAAGVHISLFDVTCVGACITSIDIANAAAFGIFIFSFYASVQLPGYYKFGVIKGQALSIFPTAGLLLYLYLGPKLRIDNAVIEGIVNSPALRVLTSIALAIVMFTVSIIISIGIFKKKEI